MFSVDLRARESAGHVIVSRRVLALIRLADAFSVHASVAEAAISAGWSQPSASPGRDDQAIVAVT
jgi:hypothetical protein